MTSRDPMRYPDVPEMEDVDDAMPEIGVGPAEYDEDFSPIWFAGDPYRYDESPLTYMTRSGLRWLKTARQEWGRRWSNFAGWAGAASLRLSLRYGDYRRRLAGRSSVLRDRAGVHIASASADIRDRAAATWHETHQQLRRPVDLPKPSTRQNRKRRTSRERVDQPRIVEEPVAPVDLRELALDAWRAAQVRQQVDETERRRQEEAQKAAALKRLVGRRLGLRINPSSGRVEVDGLTLAVRWDARVDTYALVLLSECPSCGAPVTSDDIRDLVDLGQIVEEIDNRRHLCEQCRVIELGIAPTAEERLIAALREFMASDFEQSAPALPQRVAADGAGTRGSGFDGPPRGPGALESPVRVPDPSSGRPRRDGGGLRPSDDR